MTLEGKFEQALWITHTLFERNKVSGSSANFSFRHDGQVYITGSGTCFGTLEKEDFSILDGQYCHTNGPLPSKELPLHQILYEKNQGLESVLHTHSFYSTLWSCLRHEGLDQLIPAYTPYLKMKLGDVVLVPYAQPGSEQLFRLFRHELTDANGYLLANHGPIIGAGSILEVFYALEELEESLKLAWFIEGSNREAIKMKEC